MYGPDLRPQKSKQITFPPRKNKNWTRNWNLIRYTKRNVIYKRLAICSPSIESNEV